MPRTLAHNDLSVCPRCSSALSAIDSTCTNLHCSYPNPEPGPITVVRLRLKGAADAFLQGLREVGKWPPS